MYAPPTGRLGAVSMCTSDCGDAADDLTAARIKYPGMTLSTINDASSSFMSMRSQVMWLCLIWHNAHAVYHRSHLPQYDHAVTEAAQLRHVPLGSKLQEHCWYRRNADPKLQNNYLVVSSIYRAWSKYDVLQSAVVAAELPPGRRAI